MTINHDTSRADALEEEDERNLAYSDAEPEPNSGAGYPDRLLDDIDVRAQEDGPGIEFSTFCEGEFVESIYIRRERATEIHKLLGQLLGMDP